MHLLDALLLAATLAALAALPSASVALVVARSLTHGTRAGLAVAAGIVTGDLLFAALALAGLASLAAALGALFTVLRYAGALYLVWLGLRLLLARTRPAPAAARAPRFDDPRPARGALATSYAAGLLLTLGDVKAILFYASLFPQLVAPGSLGLGGWAALLAVTVVAVGGVKAGYAFAARWLHRRLPRPGEASLARTACGGALVCAGGAILAKT